MLAAYDSTGIIEPQYFPIEIPEESLRAIWRRMKQRGVGKVLGEYAKDVVAIDGDTVLVHFGHLIRFLDDDTSEVPTHILAAYTDESSDQDTATLIAIAEQVVINPDFMAGFWEYRSPKYLDWVDAVSEPQEHLHIALVENVSGFGQHATTALVSEVSA